MTVLVFSQPDYPPLSYLHLRIFFLPHSCTQCLAHSRPSVSVAELGEIYLYNLCWMSISTQAVLAPTGHTAECQHSGTVPTL